MTVTGLTIDHPGDEDWFQFTTTDGSGQADSVAIAFTEAFGDLDLQLLDSSGQVLKTSAGILDGEQISLSGLAAGTYYVRVYGYQGTQTSPGYTLTIHGPEGSVGDRFEANDSRQTATDLRQVQGQETWTNLSINAPAGGSAISEWATSVIGYSSQSGNTAIQALGEPDVTSFGASPYAWAPHYEDFTGTDYLTLGYAHPALRHRDRRPRERQQRLRQPDRPPRHRRQLPRGLVGQRQHAVREPRRPRGDPLEPDDVPRQGGQGHDPRLSLVLLGGDRRRPAPRGNYPSNPDWYHFQTLAPGVDGNFVGVLQDPTEGDLDVYLYDSQSHLLASATTSNDFEGISLAGAAAGDYYVEVVGHDGASTPTSCAAGDQ